MFKNYLKVALRNLLKYKGYTLINVTGLAVGMTCCLLILFYVRTELSYDRHHENADGIYRVTSLNHRSGTHWACIGPPVGPALESAFPEIERVVRYRFVEAGSAVLSHEEREFEEKGILYADANVFHMFTLPLRQGNPTTALRDPHTIILTAEMVQKYFGDADAMGRILSFNGGMELKVTGVLEDLPKTAHNPFDFLISLSTFYSNAGDWLDRAKTWAGFHTYIQLKEGVDPESLTQKIPDFVARFYADRYDEPADERMSLHLQPLVDIHLHSKLEKELHQNSDIAYVYIFSVIAAFVLVIACINFVNLTTARSTRRMREIGIRKVVGAHRTQLIRQIMAESMFMVLLAWALTLGAIELTLPIFTNLTGVELALDAFQPTQLFLMMGGIAVLTGIISGSYPALLVSGFHPIDALKGRSRSTARPATFRKGLVTVQFVISIFLMAASLVIGDQLTFFRTKQLGFDKEHVIKVRLPEVLREAVVRSPETFREELSQNPAIVSMSVASEVPGERFSLEGINIEGRPDAPATTMRIIWGVDHDYLPTLGIELAQGRNFSRELRSDSSALILNEAGVRELGLSDPIGTRLRWQRYVGNVVGVVHDFHFASLHNQIQPLIIPLRPNQANHLLVRVAPHKIAEVLPFLRSTLDKIVPNQPFFYSLLGADFDRLYLAEDKLFDIFGYFTGIAIFVACLGLLGLASFAAEQRTKEIGVRKVLGASIRGVVILLSKDFSKLVALAFLISTPIAFLATRQWLQDFAYRVEIGIGTFLMAGVLALLIAWLTVFFHALKAALSNPVESLRYE
jgi:putative ABC transport system permease protein